MIRVERGGEPKVLSDSAFKHLTAMRERVTRGEIPKSEDFDGYGVAKPFLAQALKNKCCYCEKKVEAKNEGVEHYRPKTRARRGPGHPTHGYWWLAWNWENLLFACDDCNKAKGTSFPLTPSSTALVADGLPPGDEEPLLLNPSIDDPIEHIEFFPERDGRWRPRPRNNSERGKVTIETLGLDGVRRPGILDLYRDHVNDFVRPRVRDVAMAFDREDPQTIHTCWSEACRRLLRGGSIYAALSYDALSVLVPHRQRTRWNLLLWRPQLSPTTP